MCPLAIDPSEVSIPTNRNPVEFQPLHVELCARVFKIVRRAHVSLVVQEPVGCIDLFMNVESFGFQP